jgi:Uma2 family endonuclease
MSASISTSPEYVVLYGVPWETYEGIVDALAECHPRHTYDRGTLEIRRILYGVAWESYEQFLDATAEYKLRHTYDRGTLEMMAPRMDHERFSKLLGRMIEGMALALDIPILSVGSTTLAPAAAARGLQPDQSYYIAHEMQMRDKETYDPERDPPPDLTIEVDVTSTSVPRLPVYAKIKVPEIWRYGGGVVRFYRLVGRGKYEETDRSVAFPFITPDDVVRFLEQRHDTDEHSVVRAWVKWARKAHRKP